MHRSGILFVVSAPSGAGKTTLCDNLRKHPDFAYSVSCTTRKPRRGEVEGKDYHFMTESVFEQRRENHYFLETAKVHGHWYGTPLQPIKDALNRGEDMLLDIDVQGARNVRTHPDAVVRAALVDVFLMPATFEELERRLRKRATDDEKTIERRLSVAREEMRHWREYAYVILSGAAEEDVQKFRAIMKAERYRTARLILEEL